MRKICCICLALLLCFGIFGCERYDSESSKDASSMSSDESKAVSAEDSAESLPNDSSDSGADSSSEPSVSLPSSSDDESDNSSEPDNSLPPFSSGESEIVELESSDYVFGIIDDKYSNALVLNLYGYQADTYGETVYVITDEADDWSVGYEVEIVFSKLERPTDKALPIRIYADEIWMMEFADEKPIIYLYPEAATECCVKVVLNGELTCTYPEHGADGWQNFTAYPDGTLVFPDGKEYYALYWEGIQAADWDFSRGWCVPGEDTAKFLEWALAEQGLNSREANEFIVYWLPRMQNNEYNVISFQTDAYTDGAALEIEPNPDSLLRVFMTYYAADSEIEIEPQTFEGFERKGFTVVEWGGSQIG